MRFADKLFLAMTALLTFMFALFGIWMLSSDFSQLLNKEIEQGNKDSRTFHFLLRWGTSPRMSSARIMPSARP